MLNRREPPQITLHNAQEGQCNRQSNDQQDQLHGVDILLLEQPVEQEHKAQRQNVGHDGVKDALHGNTGNDKRFGESKGYIAGDQSANDHNTQNTGSLADISGVITDELDGVDTGIIAQTHEPDAAEDSGQCPEQDVEDGAQNIVLRCQRAADGGNDGHGGVPPDGIAQACQRSEQTGFQAVDHLTILTCLLHGDDQALQDSGHVRLGVDEVEVVFQRGGYKNIWIVACGSSSNGSLCARQFIRRHLKCEVKIVTPFHFVSSENDFSETDMVVVVSQSGYSLNALDAIKVIEAKGRRCIGLTGDVNSDLGKVCDVVANYGVGRETVAYVTRGVTTLALFFMLFAVEAAVRLGIKTAAEGEAVKQQLLKAADINAAVQAQTPSFIKEHYRQLSGMTNAYVCGVGANLGTASEGALKFGETVSIPTAAYEVEEYIHGPNIQMTPRYSVFLIDGGEGTERIHRIFEGTQIVTDNAFLLTRCADYKDEHNVMYVPMDVPEEITPLCWLPFFQMTACRLTDDLDRWNKHPLQRAMEKFVSSKSANYVNSPFSEDTPGRG